MIADYRIRIGKLFCTSLRMSTVTQIILSVIFPITVVNVCIVFAGCGFTGSFIEYFSDDISKFMSIH